MKKVLIITYYWPPSGGVGVQRWLKFSKYLPFFGWEPVIFTPENPDFNIKDSSLAKNIPPDLEIIKFPIWEPFKIFNKLTGGKNKENIKQGLVLEKKEAGIKDKIAIWLRGNAFIPDPRMFWINPSIKFLTEYVKDRDIQYVITTGPPHSMHLIGKGLKKRTNIKWLADFRDPWSQWDLLDKLHTSKPVKYLHRLLEKKVLQNADNVITVSNKLAKELEKLGNRKVDVILNGVDTEDYSHFSQESIQLDKFRISYFGLLNEMRNPETFWKALEELISENKGIARDLEINIAGIVSESILARLESSLLLSEKLTYHSYLNHNQVFQECSRSALLLVILNKTENAKWIIPGKLFEYLAMQKPILLLGPENSDAAEILNNLQAGAICEFDDKQKVKSIILEEYKNFLLGRSTYKSYDISQYSRKKLAGDLASLLNNL